MTVLIDSFAWLEYFFGTKRGLVVRETILSQEPLIISTVNLFEVYSKYLRLAKGEAEEKKNFMLARCSDVVEVSREITLAAAKLKAEHGLGMADAIVLATAKSKNAKILTGDRHFAKFQETIQM